jgi:NitT/TauT family transport system substrate-binding protein
MKSFWKNLGLMPKLVIIIALIWGIQAGGAGLGIWNKINWTKVFGGGRDYSTFGVVTWGGYAGGQFFNGGFEPSEESRYFTEMGIKVKFVLIDDFAASRDAFKSGEIDLLWTTADAFSTEVNNLAEFEPKIVMQADWSRGGDVIVTTWDITSVAQLRGRKVAVAFGTPSHSFLLWTLNAQGLSYDDVEIIEAPSATIAADMFKSGAVDAAVVWSPDDDACLTAVPRSHRLTSTKEATKIIADVFFAKKEWIDANQKTLEKIIRGWMIGASEINTKKTAFNEAVTILSTGLSQPDSFITNAINNVRLATYGDNKNFFGLNPGYRDVKGEDLYMKTSELYRKIGLVSGSIPPWREVVDLRALQAVTDLVGGAHVAESAVKFTPTQQEKMTQAPALTQKTVSVNFATGSATLDDNAKKVIDLSGISEDLKRFGQMGLRVEGNTDNVGSASSNQLLSEQRAKAVVDYLILAYGIDSHRVTWVGNGLYKPVADNNTAEGKARNRRTEFQLVKVM